MPEFVLLCRDKPNCIELRLQTRAAHLEYLATLTEPILMAGPLLSDDEKPIGSLIIIEAQSYKRAEAIAAADPYAKAGLFAEVEIKPFRKVIPSNA